MVNREPWRKIVNQPDNMWWQRGVNRENPKFLTDTFIHVSKTTKYIAKEFGDEWEVQAGTRINPDTVDGRFLFFKSKVEALRFANDYMRKH